jgi:pilus assembly protein Flp/PilA
MKLFRGKKGQGLVEYAILVALIVVICIAAVRTLGTNASKGMSSAAAGITF